MIVPLNRQIAAPRQAFEAGYRHAPDIRIGIHLGSVVVGEVGMLRTKLTYVGNAVNTTVRVEELAHDSAATTLITEQLRKRFDLPAELLVATSLATLNLRGKHKPSGPAPS
ncbi:MAG: hypothetical protein HYX37_17725 [Rhizobiales bacterium]|nr:hypothetical protein [Hyphomicrobiales bacterium]